MKNALISLRADESDPNKRADDSNC
jgi:hypothetical protein